MLNGDVYIAFNHINATNVTIKYLKITPNNISMNTALTPMRLLENQSSTHTGSFSEYLLNNSQSHLSIERIELAIEPKGNLDPILHLAMRFDNVIKYFRGETVATTAGNQYRFTNHLSFSIPNENGTVVVVCQWYITITSIK